MRAMNVCDSSLLVVEFCSLMVLFISLFIIACDDVSLLGLEAAVAWPVDLVVLSCILFITCKETFISII